jgi:hypothetical protein
MFAHVIIFIISVLGLTGLLHAFLCKPFLSTSTNLDNLSSVGLLLPAAVMWVVIAIIWATFTNTQMPVSAVATAFVGVLLNSLYDKNLNAVSKKMSQVEMTALVFLFVGLLFYGSSK